LIPVSPPTDRPYHDAVYDPLWAAAAACDMPLSLHIATNRPPGEWRILWSQWGFQGADRFVRDSLAQMLFGGVFDRHPSLKVVSVEHEVSWVPHFLDRLDETYTQRTPRGEWYRFADGALPSDHFRRNVLLSFIEDRLAVPMRDEIGVDNLMWGSDYPHTESTFPRSAAIVDELFAGVHDADRRAMTATNAAVLYGFDVPPDPSVH
jgi:predicted TIM-barrel fold metal-dependent hydrolase